MGLFLGQKKDEKPQNLNAKKLDVNFDGDDFFNSFEPNKPANTTKEEPSGKNKFVTKLQEVDDPFDFAKPASSQHKNHLPMNHAKSFTNGVSTDYDAQEKLR